MRACCGRKASQSKYGDDESSASAVEAAESQADARRTHGGCLRHRMQPMPLGLAAHDNKLPVAQHDVAPLARSLVQEGENLRVAPRLSDAIVVCG